MLELKVIQDKLVAEGISESLSKGINFETEEDLNGWVASYKTAIPTQKAIGDYTEDELKAMADKGEAKNLQSLIDKVRTAAKAKKEGTPPEGASTPPDAIADLKAAFQKEFDALKEAQAAGLEKQRIASLEVAKDTYIDTNTEGFGSLDVKTLKTILPATATSAEIDAKIAEFRSERLRQGLSSYRTGKGNLDKKGELGTAWDEALKATTEFHKKINNK